MEKFLFYIIFLLLGVVYFCMAYFISKSVKSVEDYFLADRKLNLFQVSISLIATQLGGGFILGTSEKAYSQGYFGLFYVLGICLGLIMLACGMAAKLRAFGVNTTAQLFEVYYKSITLKRIASLCSIMSLTGIFAAQIIGSRALMVSLGVYNPIIFIGFWALIISYAIIGGLKAIVQNDIFQLAVIILVFVGLFESS